MFKTWFREEREKRAMTQMQFAVLVGLSVPVIRAFEKGEKNTKSLQVLN